MINESIKWLVDQVLQARQELSSVFASRAAEVIVVYWLTICSKEAASDRQIPFTNALLAALTLDARSIWYLREPDMRGELETLLRSATLAKHNARLHKVDLDPALSSRELLQVVFVKASCHYAGVGDTNRVAIDTLLAVLRRMDVRVVGIVREACNQLPAQAKYEQSSSHSGCAIPLLIAGSIVMICATLARASS